MSSTSKICEIPREEKCEEILNLFNLDTEDGINNYIFCHEHEYYFIMYTFLTKNNAYIYIFIYVYVYIYIPIISAQE